MHAQGTNVPDEINKLKNPNFANGKTKPSGWKWVGEDAGASWERREGDGVVLKLDDARKRLIAYQDVSCKPDEYYRVEASVLCDFDVEGEPSGFRLVATFLDKGKPIGEPTRTSPVRRVSNLISVRAYLYVPEEVRRVRFAICVEGAKGHAIVHQARFIRVIEPEELSHMLAVPAPSLRVPPPICAERIAVCSERAGERCVTELLERYCGQRKVTALSLEGFTPKTVEADAILLPDAVPPSKLRSIKALMDLAEESLVIISLPAFSKLAGSAVKLRRIEQDDDPIHARVNHANYATRGWALNDNFAYAWRGKRIGSFVQNQYKLTGEFRQFAKKHELVTVLESLCDQDATSNRPICLIREFERGALVVLDIEPVEEPGSTFGEPALAMHLLLNLLGQTPCGLGQYMVPHEEIHRFRQNIRFAQERIEGWYVHDEDVPIEEVENQLVMLGSDEQSFGLPIRPKPLVLVRSGLESGDAESIYGSMLYFKQLLRMPPYTCPYAEYLSGKIRLGWLPVTAPWESRSGFERKRHKPESNLSIDVEDSALDTVIDVVSVPANRIRVLFPNAVPTTERYQRYLPALWQAFPPGHYFVPEVADGEEFDDRDRFDWRIAENQLEIVIDPARFDGSFHQEALSTGANVMIVEVPGNDADFVAKSILRTDIVATLLEQAIGLRAGLIAVNRRTSAARFGTFPPVSPGDLLVVEPTDPMLESIQQAG